MARNGNLHSIARLIAREARAVPRPRMRCGRCGRDVATTASTTISVPSQVPARSRVLVERGGDPVADESDRRCEKCAVATKIGG